MAVSTTTNNLNNSIAAAAAAASSSSSPSSSTPSRYENQKRRDWNTFGQYLRNHRPPFPHPNVPLLRPPKPTCSLSMPSPPSLGQPRRPHRPPSSRLRRARRQA
ncbi:unnamed protein product, partial [Vitis vinifera]